jgi:hypothetical protein
MLLLQDARAYTGYSCSPQVRPGWLTSWKATSKKQLLDSHMCVDVEFPNGLTEAPQT